MLLVALTVALAVTLTVTPAGGVHAQPAKAGRQFVYVLRVMPRFQNPAAWTDTENEVVARHFHRLSQAASAGQVILAGRTTEALDRTFGLVIFEAENEAAARAFMESDPAIIAGLMSATLHPYSVALPRR